MAHPIIFNGGLGLGLVLLSFGLNATFRPQAHLQNLEFPLHTEPTARKLDYALMRIWGIRNITVGLLIAAIWTRHDEGLMGWALCAALPMPVTDGFVSRLLIGGGELQHWVFPPLLVVMIAGLFGWF
jgi:hypothetical protein